jgi:hypothetical protein
MKTEDKYKDVIIGEVEIHGIKPFDLTGVKIYWEVRTGVCGGKFLSFEIYDRLVNEFHKNNIQIPLGINVALPSTVC